MKYTLSTLGFNFVTVDFYQSVADPGIFFEREYEEMDEKGIEEEDFDFIKYRNAFIPYLQTLSDKTSKELTKYGLKSINVLSVESPREYNFCTDWAVLEVEMDENWKDIALGELDNLTKNEEVVLFFKENYKTTSGYLFKGPESWVSLGKSFKDERYNNEIILSMYLKICHIYEMGLIDYNNWESVVDSAKGNLDFYEFSKTK